MRNFFKGTGQRKLPMHGKWLLCSGVAMSAISATYWPNAMTAFRYERMPLISGELWRLLSGHLVHINTPHMLLNLLALFLLCELLWDDMPLWQGASLLIMGSLGISAFLFVFHPELAWYAGLSGVLHCLWAGCASQGCLKGDGYLKPTIRTAPDEPIEALGSGNASRRIAAVAIILLCVKLLLESYFGPSERMAQVIGGEIIAIAHAYGALIGVACFACMVFVRRGTRR